MTSAQYEAVGYFTLDPHAEIGDGSGYIPIDVIASRVYGKKYNSLRGCQRDSPNLCNDAEKVYMFASEGDFEEELYSFDQTEIYLGWDREAGESRVKQGMTQLDYWLSIKIAERPEDVTVEANPPEHMDLEGAVFESEFFAARAFTPSLGGVIADLIRRGELPRGNYIYRHWW
jgi:hypothetical protein